MPSSACHRAHCALPSFPPRRSSDLGARRLPSRPSCVVVEVRDAGDVTSFISFDRFRNRRSFEFAVARRESTRDHRVLRAAFRVGWARSEEHTSELQSRRDLVCRLLLATAPTALYPLSLHDALPILARAVCRRGRAALLSK